MSKADVYESLRAEVLAGAFAPAEPLREVALAERFGVSRTPVREALRKLLADRLVSREGRSFVVRQVSPDEVIQVYDLRIVLESEAAKQAAQSRSEADLARLESFVERDLSLADPDDSTRMRTNLEFHAGIHAAAHNPVLLDLLDRLSVHLVQAPHSTLSVGDRWERSLEEHGAIVAAIREHEAERAASLARDHMAEARRLRLQLIREAVGRGQ